MSADNWPHRRSQGNRHSICGKNPDSAGFVIEFPNDCVADDRFGTGGQTLEDASRNQGVNRPGDGAQYGGECEADHAGQKYWAPADPIRQWAVK